MVSKAWYKSAAPKLIGRFATNSSSSSPRKAVEIWTTTCIVTNFGKTCFYNDHNHHQQPQPVVSLINPANPNLSGPNAFPYFPRGGPQPKVQPNRHAHHIMGYVSQWGGMDVGSGMMFSAETIDGLLHQLGGLRFQTECNAVPPHRYAHAYLNQQRPKTSATTANDHNNETDDTIEDSNIIVNSPNPNTKCPVGTAVSTVAAGGELPSYYDRIVHTVPPFYNYPPLITNELKQLLGIEIEDDEEGLHTLSKELLRSCYRQSFHEAFGTKDETYNRKEQSYSLLNTLASYLSLGKYQNQQQTKHSQRVAVPLLGAGCRDFPKDVALEVAALESASWLLSDSKEAIAYSLEDECSSVNGEMVVAFGLLERVDAEALAIRIEESVQLKAGATAEKIIKL